MSKTYVWERWPQAEALIDEHLHTLLERFVPARDLAAAMEREASTRLFDWLDHLVIEADDRTRAAAYAAGFAEEHVEAPAGVTVLVHPGAQLPRLLMTPGENASRTTAIAVKSDLVADSLLSRGIRAPIRGSLYSPYRVTTPWQDGEHALHVVERRGYRGYVPQERPADYPQLYLSARERWATRPRTTLDDAAGMRDVSALAQELVLEVGQDTAAWIVFEVERDYWERRNWAGRLQKARQDRLGLGWANHDHHTFRSSRTAFSSLIHVLEALGFVCRERFYAGEEAGWGVQVLEQPGCGLVVFADVDLRPDEVTVDFAHLPLPPEERLGTVGLWCALHGESLLGAGMHHLEAQFQFDQLRDDLGAVGVEMMKPFSDMPHLRQAFTRGERWSVAPERLERLRAAGSITEEQYHTFASDGAIGSHLENLQRRDGFKGFNQKNVSAIIRATDPRHAAEEARVS